MEDGYGYLGDDITLGGDPDSDTAERDIEREIERLTGGFHGPRSDGVLGAVSNAEPQLRPPVRKLTNLDRTGATVRRKTDLARPGNAVLPKDRRDDAKGVRGAGQPDTVLAAGSGKDDGAVRPGRGGVKAPRVRRKGFDSLKLLGPITDQLGTRNSAPGYVKAQFEGCHFTATLKEMKFNTAGDIDIRFVIPYEEADEGIKFAKSYGLDIEFVATRKIYESS